MLAGSMPAAVSATEGQGGTEASEASVEACERQSLNFNRSWKFIRQDVSGAEAAEFNDSYWYNVGLPHDFSIPYWQDEEHYTGYGWYRKTFTFEESWEGKQIFLDFEGVFHTAELYVNGREVGTHRGGYTGFEYDITDYLVPGENVVAVRVNNIWDATLAPRSGEHMFTGGIYRDVNLIVTSPVHVTWYGTFVQTPEISAESSKVRMQAEVKNDSDAAQEVSVVHKVLDSDDQEVAVIDSDSRILEAGETYNFDDTSEAIENPHLWSDKDPYMYKVKTDVIVDGMSVDQYETPLGFRWVEWTADQGFFLNGEHVWLNGANAHQDHAGWANAVTTSALKRDVVMIKEAGLNFIRGSHYPHSPAYAEACDEQGILFWSEVSFWCTAAYGEAGGYGDSRDYLCDGYPTTGDPEDEAAFAQSCMDQLRDMIRINRNHPSVIVWSMGNEIFFGSNLDKKKELAEDMAAYAKELDPTRSTALGGTQRSETDKLDNIDVAGYNGDGAKIEEYQDPGVANMVAEYGSHTGNRPDSTRAYYGDVQTENGEPIQYAWRSGIALWCACHHGSIISRSYGDMGFIDYYRLPLQSWYYYREHYGGIAVESSSEGTPSRLSLSASDTEISNNGTEDSHIIVTVEDENGTWLNTELEVTLEVVSGPGIFPTGKTMIFEPGSSMRDGKAAIEFRSYYAGETVIRATAEGLEPAELTITVTGSDGESEPDINTLYGSFMSGGGEVLNPITDAEAYTYVNYANSPTSASSGEDTRLNVADNDDATQWQAEEPGAGQWIYMELEHGGMNLYKAQLVFNGKVYPYKIQYKEMNIDEDEWKTLVEYDSDTVQTRPAEESFYGTYMRYIRIEFTDVPEDEYANLAELRLYGLRSDTVGYETGYRYLSDVEMSQGDNVTIDKSAGGGAIQLGGTAYAKGISTQGSAEIIYDLENDAAGYATFRCRTGLDVDSGADAEATVQIYGDDQLMYEQTVSNPETVLEIEVSVNRVKELKLVVTTDDSNAYVDCADAKLIGVMRNITSGQELDVKYFSNTETLVPGKDLEIETVLVNKQEEPQDLAAILALYDSDGGLLDTTAVQNFTLAGGEEKRLSLGMEIPEDVPVGSNVRLVLWGTDDLLPKAETTAVSRVIGDPEKDKYPEVDIPQEETGRWVTVTGDEVSKTGTWGRWTPANGSVSGYETFVDYTSAYHWENTSIEQEFTGSRVKVLAKKDGSQHGAEIYIDGELIREISTYTDGGDVYTEVFDSGDLEFGSHIIKIVPTGKFGLDCIQYYTEDRIIEYPEPEEGYDTEIKVRGEDERLEKTGGWDYWTPPAGTEVVPESGYETFAGSSGSRIKFTFIGTQTAVAAKVDGSQHGAEIYIDGEKAATVSTNGSPDEYKQVFDSGTLPYGEHTLEIVTTGKFGFDYVTYYTGHPEDRTALTEAAEQYRQLNPDDYAAGWDAFETALADAERISTRPGYTQEEIDQALENLIRAADTLVLYVERDLTQLLTGIKESLEIISTGRAAEYDSILAAGFTSVLSPAAEAAADKGQPQEMIDQAAEEIRAALDALTGSQEPEEPEKPVSKNTLEYFLNSAKEHLANGDVDDCVQSIKDLFNEAIAEGDAVMADEYATREEVMNASVKLMKAVQALGMKAADKTDLEMAVELAEMIDLTDYIDAGQQEFTDALAAANAVLADGDAMQADADEAWNALVDAMANLRLKADKAALEALLNEAAGLDLTQYTEESAAVFRMALASAQAVFTDDALTEDDQETVDNAVAALMSARDGLTAKADDSGNGSSNAGGSGSGTGSGASVKQAAKTGDAAPIIALLLTALVSGTVAIAAARRRTR